MVDGARLGGNVHAGVDPAGLHDLPAVGHHLDERDLDDPVAGRIHTGGLQVEEDDGSFEVELHVGPYALIIMGMISIRVSDACLSS